MHSDLESDDVAQLLRHAAGDLEPRLGQWTQAPGRRASPADRLMLLATYRDWVDGERVDPIRAFVGEAPVAASLLLAVDLAFAQVVERAKANSQILGALIPIHAVRRWILGRLSADAMLEDVVASDVWSLVTPDIWRREQDFHALRGVFRALESAGVVASHVSGRHDLAEIIDSKPTDALHHSFVQDVHVDRPSVAHRLRARIEQIGRRNLNPTIDRVVSARAAAECARMLLEDGRLVRAPQVLVSGRRQAMEYCSRNGLMAVSSIDGAGQFVLRVDDRVRSKQGESRTVLGYAFTAAGESAYVVETSSGLTHKRTTKASSEYELEGSSPWAWQAADPPVAPTESRIDVAWHDLT